MSSGKTVLILGGGVAGLSAAHELGQRGFHVEIWEASDDVGGRARSKVLDGVPTEHGFHFFPAFYRHLHDTLKRIPDQTLIGGLPKDGNGQPEPNSISAWIPGQTFSPNSVLEQLVASSRVVLARDEKTELDFDFDIQSWTDAFTIARSFAQLGLSPAEIALAAAKLARVIADVRSGTDGSLEQITWWDYIEADSQSATYQEYLGEVAVRWTVAMDPRKASARTIGRVATQFWLAAAAVNEAQTSPNGVPATPFAQVLSGPTSEVWLEPWKTYLVGRLKVEIKSGRKVHEILCEDRCQVTGVLADGVNGPFHAKLRGFHQNQRDLEFDYCICALPILPLIGIIEKSQQLRESEPSVRQIPELRRSMNWMVGIQFYLAKDVPVARGGLMLRDSPWALTATSQLQFWEKKRWTLDQQLTLVKRPPFLNPPNARNVEGVISVIIADWESRGHFQDRTAKSCTEDQLFWEVWQELKAHFNNEKDPGGERQSVLEDNHLIGYYCSISRDSYSRTAVRDILTAEAQRDYAGREAHDTAVPAPGHREALAKMRSCVERLEDEPALDVLDELKAIVNGWPTLGPLVDTIIKRRGAKRKIDVPLAQLRMYALDHGEWYNPDPLFINTVGSASKRPEVVTSLRNFFLAGDYVRTYTDLATMEAANESGRRAVNGILEEAKSPLPRCELWPLEVPLASIGVAGLRRGATVLGDVGRRGIDSAVGVWRSVLSNWRGT